MKSREEFLKWYANRIMKPDPDRIYDWFERPQVSEQKLMDIGKVLVASAVNGKPFRHILMRPKSENHPKIWFKVIEDGRVHVIGPDDIIAFDDAIPLVWRIGNVWELQSPKDKP